ncbi:MAG TPA: hypothetical protein VFU73_03500 [Actinocrinis sp.]|nr:hypothetical protein [Actinocrinis sp.]
MAALLTQSRRAPVVVVGWQHQEPWSLARVQFSGDSAPPTAIVKWVRCHSAAGRAEPWRLRLECAALRYLSDDLRLAFTPRVLAMDPFAGFAVLEDLAPRVALDRLIDRDGVGAHLERLRAFARALGTLGAATSRRATANRPWPTELTRLAAAADPLARLSLDLDEVCEHATGLGVRVTGGVESDLQEIADELRAPGPFFALSNGAAGADNVLVQPGGPADARLIDFEAATFTHALLDAVCLHVPGPGWLSVGDPVALGVADCYRSALARGVPQAADDRLYGFGLTAACTWWALQRLRRYPKLDARAPGDRSRPQLVETLEAAARVACAYRALANTTGWIRAVAERLRQRWPDADLDFTGPAAMAPYSPRREVSPPVATDPGA